MGLLREQPAREVLPPDEGGAGAGRARDPRLGTDGVRAGQVLRCQGFVVTRLRALVARVLAVFRRRRWERDLDDELAAHLEMHVDDNLRAGMTQAGARRAALLKLGGVEQTKELVRDRRHLPVLDALAQDVRLAVPLMRRSPGLTAAW